MTSTPLSTLEGVCAHCGTSPDKALHCSKCCVTVYCGKECQTAHWRAAHRVTCDKVADQAHHQLISSLGGLDTLNKLLHEAFENADPRPHRRGPMPQALTPQSLDRLIALTTARRSYSSALSALTVRALQCWQDPSAVEALKRAYATRLLEMRAQDETEDRFVSFVATTAAASLLSDIGDVQELVKVSNDCWAQLKDASLDTRGRIWVYKRLGCILLEYEHEAWEMNKELTLAAGACFRRALKLATFGKISIKIVAELKLLLGVALFCDDRYEESVRVTTLAYEILKAEMSGYWSSGVALQLAQALCYLRRVGEARAFALRAFEICERVGPVANVRMVHLIELLYEIDFSTGRYQDALELATRGINLACDTDAVLMSSDIPPALHFMLLRLESAQDWVDEIDEVVKAGQGGELLPSHAQRLGPAFATREARRLISAGRIDEAEQWLQAAVDSAKQQATRILYAWGLEQRALEPQEMLLGLLEARGTPDALNKAGKVRGELRATAKARDEVLAQTLAEARDVIRSTAKKTTTTRKQTVTTSATDRLGLSEVTAKEDAHARAEVEAPIVGNGEEEEDLCSLCLDRMDPVRDAEEEVESPVCVQECGHRHHDACLDHMVEFQLKKGLRELECPICRKPLLRVRRWCVDR